MKLILALAFALTVLAPLQADATSHKAAKKPTAAKVRVVAPPAAPSPVRPGSPFPPPPPFPTR